MQGMKRKIVYVTMFEVLAVFLSSILLALLANKSITDSSAIAVISSTIAFLWNFFYNSIFELWESKQIQKGRSVVRRLVHTTFFQVGMVAMIVPMLSWKLNISITEAFVMNLSLLGFFLVYSFVYSICFDKLFGLPASSQ